MSKIEEEFACFRGMSEVVNIQGDAPPDFEEGKPEGEPHRRVSTGLWRIEEAVRAAMLAVLDEVEGATVLKHDDGSGCVLSPSKIEPVANLRREIQELGR